MIEIGSYGCSFVERPVRSSQASSFCVACFLRLFGVGSGVMKRARPRSSMIFCVVCPCSSSSQWREDRSYGELRWGGSISALDPRETLSAPPGRDPSPRCDDRQSGGGGLHPGSAWQ